MVYLYIRERKQSIPSHSLKMSGNESTATDGGEDFFTVVRRPIRKILKADHQGYEVYINLDRVTTTNTIWYRLVPGNAVWSIQRPLPKILNTDQLLLNLDQKKTFSTLADLTNDTDQAALVIGTEIDIKKEHVAGCRFVIRNQISGSCVYTKPRKKETKEVLRLEGLKLPSIFDYENKDLAGTTMNSFDLFCGAGGNALGLRKAGIFSGVGLERCHYASSVYEKIHPDCAVIQRDAIEVLEEFEKAVERGEHIVQTIQLHLASLEDVPTHLKDLYMSNKKVKVDMTSFDVLHCSPPCQAFSGANAMAAIRASQLPNSQLDDQLHYVDTTPRFVKCLNPTYIVVEMVPNITTKNLSGNKDGAVQKLIFQLLSMDYQVSMNMLNAADFGAPQERKRCVIIAAKEDYTLPDPPVKTHGPRCFGHSLKPYVTMLDAIGDLPFDLSKDSLACPYYKERSDPNGKKTSEYARVMRQEHVFETMEGNGLKAEIKRLQHRSENGKLYVPVVWNHQTVTRNCSRDVDGNIINPIDHCLNQVHKAYPGTTCYGNTKMVHYNRKRLLTVREHARMQGIPDYVIFPGKLERQYKTVNNAVPVQMATAVGLTILKASKSRSYDDVLKEQVPDIESFRGTDVENDDAWSIHDVFQHKVDEHYVVDDVRKMGEVCSCADCAKMKDSGPGWRVEVGWGEYWHEQKYGRLRDESGNIVGDNEYWAPDFEMVMNENVNYYATKLYALDDVCVKHEAFQESSTSGAGPSASGAGPSSRGAGRPSNDRPQKRQRTTFNI